MLRSLSHFIHLSEILLCEVFNGAAVSCSSGKSEKKGVVIWTNAGNIGEQFVMNNISFVSNSTLLILEGAKSTEFMLLFELLCEFQKTTGCYHCAFNYEFNSLQKLYLYMSLARNFPLESVNLGISRARQV